MDNFERQLKRRSDLLFSCVLFFILGFVFLYGGLVQDSWYVANHWYLSCISFIFAFICFLGYQVSVNKERYEATLVGILQRPKGKSTTGM
jgi:hypothetical protein